MRFIALVLLLPSLLSAQESQPELTWTSQPSGFRVLTIKHAGGQQVHPLLPYVFFDSGSAVIPERYARFTSPEQTLGFSEDTLHGNSVERYYSVLNIIGARLRANPALSVKVQGCNGGPRVGGETQEVSQRRAQVVADYLVQIWSIDTSRVVMLPPRNLPMTPSNTRDPLGQMENCRAEIVVDDPAGAGYPLARPLVEPSGPTLHEPEGAIFTMRNGIDDRLVVNRSIEITRGGSLWHTLSSSEIGRVSGDPFLYRWGRNGDERQRPDDPTPLVAQLVVTGSDGTEHRSVPVEIPVQILTAADRGSRNPGVSRFALIQFEFDSPRPGPLNERILREMLYPSIGDGAAVVVTGHTDVIGLEDRNRRLAQDRAYTVAAMIKKNVTAKYASVESKGVGGEYVLYRNDIPEGRFYNRTVTIEITAP